MAAVGRQVGSFCPAHDLGGALGGLPAHLADADRIGVHHLRLTLLHLRVIEETHGGGVDDDALARRVGQDELRRDHDLAVFAGQPGIHTRIGAHDFFVADVEAARDVGERVFLGCEGLLHHADDVGGRVDFEAMGRRRFRQCRHRRGLISVAFAAPARTIAEQGASRKQYGSGRQGKERARHETIIHVGIMTPHDRFSLSALCYRSVGWFGSSSRLWPACTGKCRSNKRPTASTPASAPSAEALLAEVSLHEPASPFPVGPGKYAVPRHDRQRFPRPGPPSIHR